GGARSVGRARPGDPDDRDDHDRRGECRGAQHEVTRGKAECGHPVRPDDALAVAGVLGGGGEGEIGGDGGGVPAAPASVALGGGGEGEIGGDGGGITDAHAYLGQVVLSRGQRLAHERIVGRAGGQAAGEFDGGVLVRRIGIRASHPVIAENVEVNRLGGARR